MTTDISKDMDKEFHHVQWAGKEYIMSRMEDENATAMDSNGIVFDNETLYWAGYIYRYWNIYTGYSRFGSYAKGKNNPDSDVDILIEFDSVAVVTLLTLCRIKNQMEELLKVPVDVVTLPIPEDSMLELNKVMSLYAS